jgi:excisionase family DNA binding protein
VSDAVRALLSELLDLAEGDDEVRARLCALVEPSRQAPESEPRFLTIAEVVERSRLSESTVRRAVTAGGLRSTKLGGRRLVSLDDFEDWTGTGTTGATPARLGRPPRRGGASFSSLVRSRGQ